MKGWIKDKWRPRPLHELLANFQFSLTAHDSAPLEFRGPNGTLLTENDKRRPGGRLYRCFNYTRTRTEVNQVIRYLSTKNVEKSGDKLWDNLHALEEASCYNTPTEKTLFLQRRSFFFTALTIYEESRQKNQWDFLFTLTSPRFAAQGSLRPSLAPP